MKKLFILIIFIQIASPVFAQKEANNWALSNYQLDFNAEEPEVSFEYAEYLNLGLGLISDENGDLLFYSDGYSVWNKNHQLMPNGSEVIPSPEGLTSRESLVIPHPSDNQLYYLFTVDPWEGFESSGLYYSVIDMRLESGLGDVKSKGEKIIANTSKRITAALHENLEDYWVVVHEYNTSNYYSFLVNSEGVSNVPVVSSIGGAYELFQGQLKFSPDGRRIASSRDYDNLNNTSLDLFDFDSGTGKLTNGINLVLPAMRTSYGVAFSSDAKKLYVSQEGSTGESGLYQFDLEFVDKASIQDSRKLLHREVFNQFRFLQLATNGKIYITKGGGGGGTEHLGVISNVNEIAENVVVEENGFFTEGGFSLATATPNFIQNYFFKTSFLQEGTCQSSPTNFRITNSYLLKSTHWDFGDGATSVETNPQHTYIEAGTYAVTLTANYADHSDVITREITINPFPVLELGEALELCSGSKLTVEEVYASYRWSTGDTTNTTRVSQTGYYFLEVTNELGCISKDSVYIDVVELPEINLPDTLSLGIDPVEINPGQFNSYAWSTGEITPSIFIAQPGWYSILVSNEFGCESAKSFYVSDDSEIQEKPNKWIRLNPQPSSLAGTDIVFVDDFSGFVVNSEELLITKDQGRNWEKLMNLDNGFRISFKDGYGIIIGSRGAIYKSTYKGEGWNLLEINLNDNLNSISQLSKETFFITGDSTLYKTFDGGVTWSVLEISDVNVEDAYFISENIGHVVCKNGVIKKTIDGGETWYLTEASNTAPSNFFRVTFVNEQIGYATQEHSEVYKTIDGGETWHELTSLDAAYAIQFIDKNIGFIAGEDGVIHKTEDGGDTWDWLGFDGRKFGNSLYGIHFINTNLGFATGLGGRIIRTFDGGKTWENYSITYGEISNVEVTSNETVYMHVGNDIIKSTNQGEELINLGSPFIDQKTQEIDFISNEIGFALVGGTPGSSGISKKVLKTVDGGLTWSLQNRNDIEYGSNGLIAMNFIDENTGFISGSRGQIFKTVDSGVSWTEINSPGDRIGEFQFTDSDIGYASNTYSYYNRVFKTMDKGENWELIYENSGDPIYAMHFIDNEVGYLIGDPELGLHKTSNGGDTWEAIDIPSGWFKDVYFHNENYGFICNENGYVFETLDGGKNWEPTNELSGIMSFSSHQKEIYAYGVNGNLLRNSILLSDQFRLSSLKVVDFRDTKTTLLNTELLSSIDKLAVSLELSSEGSIIGLYEYGIVNAGTENLEWELTNLEDNSTYYCRIKIEFGDEVFFSEQIMFDTFLFDPILGLEEGFGKDIVIYPNPTENYLKIEGFDNLLEAVLLNLNGVEIKKELVNPYTMDLSDIAPGIYILLLNGKTHHVFRQVIVR